MIYFPLLVSFIVAATTPEKTGPADAWHQWRGPTMNGVAPEANPPVEWSEDKNIKWKVEIPGHGHSTPIVVKDLVILQTAIPVHPAQPAADAGGESKSDAPSRDPQPEERSGRGDNRRNDDSRAAGTGGQAGTGGPERGRGGRGMRSEAPAEPYKFTVMALDRRTGKPAWERTVRELVPHEGNHADGSLAPASPVTDGQHIFAYFGSRGLYCLTLRGEVVWEKDLGDMQTRNGFGEGGSPALHGDTIIVNWDHEGEDFIVALDKKTGEEKWRRERDEPTSWATPVFLESKGGTQVVVSAANRIRSYDLQSGEPIWETSGLGLNVIPTPVADESLVFVMSGFRDPALLAVRYSEAKGNVSDSVSIAWRTTEGTSYVPSALLYDGTLYFVQKNTGILSCVDAATGSPHYEQQRLENITGVYASPVGAGGRVYIVGRNGVTHVLKHGKAFETLAENRLEDEFSASPAIAGNELFLRGQKRLYCVAE